MRYWSQLSCRDLLIFLLQSWFCQLGFMKFYHVCKTIVYFCFSPKQILCSKFTELMFFRSALSAVFIISVRRCQTKQIYFDLLCWRISFCFCVSSVERFLPHRERGNDSMRLWAQTDWRNLTTCLLSLQICQKQHIRTFLTIHRLWRIQWMKEVFDPFANLKRIWQFCHSNGRFIRNSEG